MRRSIVAVVVSLLVPSVLAGPAEAGWRAEGPEGGEIHSVAFSPRDSTTALAGTSSGQVYLTRDGGGSWDHGGSTYPLPGWIVAALHFDATDPDRLWAGLRGIWGGAAVVVSDDLGRTWEPKHVWNDDTLYALTTVPGWDGRLVVGLASGVWRSSDHGDTWRELTDRYPEIVEVSSLLAVPGPSPTLVAGTFRRAYRSDDAGSTWRAVFEGMALDSQVFSLHPVTGRPGEIWASTCGWVYHGTDLGTRWTRHREGLGERRTPAFQVLPSGRLLAGTVAGVYASEDHGRSWKRQTRDDLSVLSIAHHPERPELVLVGTEGSGVWRSTDGGSSFQPATRGIRSSRVSALAASSSSLLVGIAHGGPVSGIYSIAPDGSGPVQMTSQVPTILSLAFAGGRAWAGTEKGLWVRRNGVWSAIPELDGARIEQVVGGSEGVLVRTPTAVLEDRGGRFVEVPAAPPRPRSIAFHQGSLWVSAEGGIHRMAGAAPARREAPEAGELVSFGDHLALASPRGVWRENGEVWQRLAEERGRLLATGATELPGVVVTGNRAFAFDRGLGRFVALELPIPARDVLAAAVFDHRLYLGTAGYGVLSRGLDELRPSGGGGKPPVAAGAP